MNCKCNRIIVLLLSAGMLLLAGCNKNETALYKQYKYPNEEYFGEMTYSEIKHKASDSDKKEVADIMKTAEAIFSYTGTKSDAPKNVGTLDKYYYYNFVTEFYINQGNKTSVEYSLDLITVNITGNSGYMWVVYSVSDLDENGNEMYASQDILSRWEIKMKDAEWKVTSIQEAP